MEDDNLPLDDVLESPLKNLTAFLNDVEDENEDDILTKEFDFPPLEQQKEGEEVIIPPPPSSESVKEIDKEGEEVIIPPPPSSESVMEEIELDLDEEEEEEDVIGLEDEIKPPPPPLVVSENKDVEGGDDDGDDIYGDIFGQISEDEEEEPEVFEIPENIPRLDRSQELLKLKLPTTMSFVQEPFDNDEHPVKEEYPNIHFRYVVDAKGDFVEENGGVKKESNSRIIKWSDGTFSLKIGSEFHDIKVDDRKGKANSQHVFYRGLDQSFFLEQGKLEKNWSVRGKVKKQRRKARTGMGIGLDQDVGIDPFRKRTKLTDKILDIEDIIDERELKIREQARKLREKQEKRRKRIERRKMNEDDGPSMKRIKKEYRQPLKKRTGKKRKRGRKKKSGEDVDGFIVNEDGMEMDVDESDDESESEVDSDDYGDDDDDEDDDEDELERELGLYQDISGSDSDETYRPGAPARKKRKLRR